MPCEIWVHPMIGQQEGSGVVVALLWLFEGGGQVFWGGGLENAFPCVPSSYPCADLRWMFSHLPQHSVCTQE